MELTKVGLLIGIASLTRCLPTTPTLNNMLVKDDMSTATASEKAGDLDPRSAWVIACTGYKMVFADADI